MSNLVCTCFQNIFWSKTFENKSITKDQTERQFESKTNEQSTRYFN